MIWIPLIIVIIISLLFELKFTNSINYMRLLIVNIISILIIFTTFSIDYGVKTSDQEIWSGTVINWEHNEEYDEWIPPTYDDKGNQTSIGYYDHHDAENKIKTTDNGWFCVNISPNGKRMNDNWPNTTNELQAMWPHGTPSASVHTYENKIQASYSTFRHSEVDLNLYPNLPKYPLSVNNYICIDRIVGEVPNKTAALNFLQEKNSYLNKQVPNPEKPGKTKSYKEVNLIFVNVGNNKHQNYGFALQDKWEGGNKNDFIVSFSLDNNNKPLWVYTFSWSDIEILKLEVNNYIMSQQKIDNFVPIIDNVSKMVEQKFVRKQFKDFNYLNIETSLTAIIITWILNLILLIVHFLIIKNEYY